MSRWGDDDLNDDDEDEEYIPDDEDEETTMPCPKCGAAVYDDAEWCPNCETYISEEDPETFQSGIPMWAKVTALVLLFTVLGFWIV